MCRTTRTATRRFSTTAGREMIRSIVWARRLRRRVMSTTTGWGRISRASWTCAGRSVECAHDYDAAAGQSVCVPFVVTNKGYGIVWDNPSKTRVDFAFNEQTKWTSQVGQRVSFFVIVGDTYDELYEGYQAADGQRADAAEVGVWVHPVQAEIHDPEGVAGCGERVSRAEAARGCDGGGLVLLYEDGPDGYGSALLAGPGGDE